MHLITFLEQFMTPDRVQRMKEVVDLRTRFITVVLEDIYQPHNISAVLRSCDCFGIQDIHVMQGNNKYELNPDVSLGSAQWLNINLYEKEECSTGSLFSQLRKKGYRIIATTPNQSGAAYPRKLNLDKPIALIMGSEVTGLSTEAIENADEKLEIPMFGFTESFNISVATALILQTLRNRLHLENVQWGLSGEEKTEILTSWYKSSIKESELLIKEFQKISDHPI